MNAVVLIWSGGCYGVSVYPVSGLTFAKYQGLGNDFILVDNRHTPEPVLTPEQSAKVRRRLMVEALLVCHQALIEAMGCIG